jgi:hypothetical protein
LTDVCEEKEPSQEQEARVNAAVISEESRVTRKKCLTRLHQNLADQGIVASPSANIDFHDKPRGGVYLLRFIPQKTLFELQPGAPKYFQVARRYDLLSHTDADLLVSRLAALASSLRSKYSGRLVQHLHRGTIAEFLDSASDSQSLGLLEATEDWFPDILHEQLHWPCVVDEYLMAREFSDLRLDFSTISEIASNPIRALIGALGIVRTGHWMGLTTGDITTTLRLLSLELQEADGTELGEWPKTYAQKVVIPVFSLGFQGAIIGFFSKLEERQKPRLRNTLDEVGRCLGELFALERKSQLLDLLSRDQGDAKSVADVAIQIASPVEHIVVSRGSDHYAYVSVKEEDYLAGYEQVSGCAAEKLIQNLDNEVYEVRALDPPARIYIKTLQGYEALDPVIHWLRIKTAFLELFLTFSAGSKLVTTRTGAIGIVPLDVADVDRVMLALEHQLNIAHGRRVAAKHLCFLEMVRAQFAAKETRLNNAEIKRRIAAKLNASKVNGYQVTGEALKKFQQEVEDLLPNRFLFETISDKVIRVRWA